MNSDVRNLLISEIDKYKGRGSLIIKKDINDITLYDMLDNDILMKKILIENEYGVIGNILYNYRENIDSDILVRLCLRDYFNDEKRYMGMMYLLDTNKDLCSKLLGSKDNVKILVDKFRMGILNYISGDIENDKDFILLLINSRKDDEKNNVSSLAFLNDRLKNDKTIVYEFFKDTNLIVNYDCFNGTVKDLYMEILTNMQLTGDNYGIGLSILSDELKSDVDIVKLVLEKVYGFYAEDKEYTIKGLHMAYADSLKEQLDNGGIYGRPLRYSDDLPLILLEDREFIKYVIDVDDEVDRKYLEKVYNLEPKKGTRVKKEYVDALWLSDIKRNTGRGLIKKYEFEEAIKSFDEGIELYPYYHGCYCDKVECLVKLGRLDEAIEFLNGVINSNELKMADKLYYSSCSNDATYQRYNYKLFIKKLTNKLNDTKDKKNRGYVYKPRNKRDC